MFPFFAQEHSPVLFRWATAASSSTWAFLLYFSILSGISNQEVIWCWLSLDRHSRGALLHHDLDLIDVYLEFTKSSHAFTSFHYLNDFLVSISLEKLQLEHSETFGAFDQNQLRYVDDHHQDDDWQVYVAHNVLGLCVTHIARVDYHEVGVYHDECFIYELKCIVLW